MCLPAHKHARRQRTEFKQIRETASHTLDALEALVLERLFDYSRCMSDSHGLVPITDKRGRVVWVDPAPERCPDGHPWHLGDGSYNCGWAPCACAGAAANRNGHTYWRCQICNGTIYRPPCVDESLHLGYRR